MSCSKREGQLVEGVINVGSADLPSFLIVGSEKILLVDANMSFMSRTMLRNLALHLPPGRGVDGILLTHSHYDHVGGIPWLRSMFPDLIVYGSPVAAIVLERDDTRRMVRNLNMEAQLRHGIRECGLHDDLSSLTVDCVVADNEEIPLGDDGIVALATPGHTRCSTSYLLRNRKMLFGGESFGVRLTNGTVSPAYLSSYEDYIASLRRCASIGADTVCLPHFGVLTELDATNYWSTAIADAEESAAFIATLLRRGCELARIVQSLKQRYYIDNLRCYLPERAFEMDARRSIELIADLSIPGSPSATGNRLCDAAAPATA
jgi:2-aminobenzoylacetyl-CoA thioesterase